MTTKNSPQPPPKRVAVVGAGLTGLSCAYTLLHPTNPSTSPSNPLTVDVYEATQEIGGIVTTKTYNEFIYENGPSSMRLKYPDVSHLLLEKLKLLPRIVQKKHDGIFVLKEGGIEKLGKSPLGLLKSGVISTKAKVGIVREAFGRRLIAAENGKGEGEREVDDMTIGDFFRKRFDREVADYMVDPFIGGVYAGKTDVLSVRHCLPTVWEKERKFGSVIRGFLLQGLLGKKEKRGEGQYEQIKNGEKARVRKKGMSLNKSFNFDEGMKLVPLTMYDGIVESGKGNVFKGRKVKRIAYNAKTKKWKINRRKSYDAVVVTVPSYRLPAISWNLKSLTQLCEYLGRKVDYAPVNILSIAFKRSQVGNKMQGQGLLLPSNERRDLLGIRFNEKRDASFGDSDELCYTVYLGGSRRPDIAQLDDNDSIMVARKEMEKLLGVKGPPSFYDLQRWPRGIPQFTLGYQEVLDKVTDVETALEGNFVFAGTYRSGVAVPDAIHSGIQSAQKVLRAF